MCNAPRVKVATHVGILSRWSTTRKLTRFFSESGSESCRNFAAALQ